ncbi:MAG: STAS domain-containing protein [Dehalococcoidia bacterium]
MSGTSSIIKVGSTLIVTISEEIGDNDAVALQESINERIEQTDARGLLMDIASLETVDSFLGRLLNEIALGARLLGAETVVSGMRPAVAMTLIELGLQLRGVSTALDSERGLAKLGVLVRERS